MAVSFISWYNNIKDVIQNGGMKDLENHFNGQKNDFSRVSLLLKQPEIFDTVVLKSFKPKCKKLSENARNLGNKQFANLKLVDSMKCYSESISLAESCSQELALAYGNRSAVLFEKKEYALCQADINAALLNKYPSDRVYKLYERLGKCYLELSLYEQASEALSECLQCIKVSDLTEDQKNTKLQSISNMVKGCQENFSYSCLNVQNFCYVVRPPVILKKNTIYPSTSEALKIVSTNSKGRHAIASRDIKAGEVIIIEKPFASLCLPECYNTHCYHCLTRFKINYPCRLCSTVNYCSISCEKESWEKFHCFECEYLGVLINDDVGLAHLAFKIITNVGISMLLSFKENNSFDDLKPYSSTDYNSIFSLIGNSELRKPADLFRRALLSIYIGKILCLTNFCSTENLKIVCAHLLKHIQMLPCNAHEVSELQLKASNYKDSELKEIGSAVYATLSLLNHSCDPSVVRHCYGDTCVLRAIKHIKEGSEIVDNYGFLYAVESKVIRQSHLMEQYYFACQCEACSNDWPLYQDLVAAMPSFLCSKCSKCYSFDSSCCVTDKEVLNFQALHSKYSSAMLDVLENGNVTSNLSVLLEYLDLLSRKAILPIIHFNNCQEIVKLCFSLQGNCVKL
ncbi:SET and MYND domain-containing protein 4 [Hydra vulgaris]|uniref:SET and MYND domain-containing protein 4 n=1 Tax=Hydra vulgaris TaxID=6087 RepID=UPI0006414239|nr:SET and MYND domain-containing protein 4 [Hydra vulgaris]